MEVALDPTQGLAQGKEEDDPDQDDGHLADDIPGCRRDTYYQYFRLDKVGKLKTFDGVLTWLSMRASS